MLAFGKRFGAKALLAIVGLIGIIGASQSAPIINYSVTNISGTTWKYDYTVSNPAPSGILYEFTTWFDRAMYSNLAVAGSPAGWDSIVIQRDLGIPADGYFDSLALGSGINLGDSLSGFAVQFTYLGTGTPGSQRFEIINPSTFVTLYAGTTTLTGSGSSGSSGSGSGTGSSGGSSGSGSGTGSNGTVSTPATLPLLALPIIAMLMIGRKKIA